MGNKRKWYSILLVGLVLILATSVVGCAPSYTEVDLDAAREAGYNAGYEVGYDKLTADYDALKVLYEDAKNELSEVKKSSEPEPDSEVKSMFDATLKPEEAEEPQVVEEGQVIKDLAYIKASTWRYSDDADPEYEGLSIRLSYYDSKSELITPSGVSVEVTVELYWYTNFPPIYKEKVTINYTGALTELLKEVIRIPYGDIQAKPSGMTRGPISILTINTPNQGNFEVEDTISGFIWP